MKETKLQIDMKNQLYSKELFEQAKDFAYDYINRLPEMDVYPSQDKCLLLANYYSGY